MSTRNESIYPTKPTQYSSGKAGLTIRQYFASNEKVEWNIAYNLACDLFKTNLPTHEEVIKAMAVIKVLIADALIAELNK